MCLGNSWQWTAGSGTVDQRQALKSVMVSVQRMNERVTGPASTIIPTRVCWIPCPGVILLPGRLEQNQKPPPPRFYVLSFIPLYLTLCHILLNFQLT